MLKGRPVVQTDFDKLEKWATKGLIIYTGQAEVTAFVQPREDKTK